MAKQHFVKSARKPIYRKNSETGEDEIFIDRGESYYWYKFRYRPRKVSKTPFTQSELTYGRYGKPEWDSKYEDFSSRVDECDIEDKDELYNEIEEYRDELQVSLDNIPCQLQESHILTERISLLDDFLATLDELDNE